MGKYSKRQYLGQRPGSGKKKITKEIRHGRWPGRNSDKQHRIRENIRILGELEQRISSENDPRKLDKLCNQYANSVASFNPKDFSRTEIKGIVRYSDLENQDNLRDIHNNPFYGSRPDFLPLHHLVKLVGNGVYSLGQTEKYIYMLGSTSKEPTTNIYLRNLRALEFFLATFSNRVSSGQSLDLKIDGQRIQVPNHDNTDFDDKTEFIRNLRQELKNKGIDRSPQYNLTNILSGSQKVNTSLNVITERRIITGDYGYKEKILISYLTK